MKKKLLFGFIFMLICGMLSAQDLIVLKDGKIIKAKVLMIGYDGIEYKSFENQTGPSYKLPVNEILSLQYENGTVENLSLFQTQTEEKKQSDASESSEDIGRLFVRDGHHIYGSNGKELDSDEKIERLFKTNPAAFDAWSSSAAPRRANIAMKILTPVLTGISGVLYIAGTICIVDSYNYYDNYYYYYGSNYYYNTGVNLICAASTFLAMGIAAGVMIPVTRSIQNRRVQEAVDFYNGGLHSKNKASLDFGVTNSGGLGFMLKF